MVTWTLEINYTKKIIKQLQKAINIDDSLFEKIRIATEKNYDAKLSDIINVAIEEYIQRDNPHYYAKPKKETVTLWFQTLKIYIQIVVLFILLCYK